MNIWDFLNYKLVNLEGYQLTVYRLLVLILVWLIVRLFVWSLKKLLLKKFQILRNIDKGRQFAIIRLATYVVYIIGLTIALEVVGVGLSIFWAGSAALLVGIGLGLQQTFNDLISGLILLFEGSVKVGDIIELDGAIVGKVVSIGLRTSTVETRDSIVVIVPNSKFIVEKVINWSANKHTTRFIVQVGVAYGSDVELVKQTLIEAAMMQENIVKEARKNNVGFLDLEAPFVRFRNFGDSALEFDLLFWTTNMWHIEEIKSDIRFSIDKLFRERKIEIPFPQRDVHFKINTQEATQLKKIWDSSDTRQS